MASFIISCCSAFALLISLIKYCCYYNKYRRYRYRDIYRPHPLDIDYSYHSDDDIDNDDILFI